MNEFLRKQFAEFVKKERLRVFEPDASFAHRIVSQMKPVGRSAAAVWDYIPVFARPMVLATTILLIFIVGLQIMYPQPPEMGIVDEYLAEYLDVDAAPAEEWLYRDADLPEGNELLIEISLAE